MDTTLTQVLLIEDNPADRLLLSEALEQDTRSSFEVTNVDHLQTAVHKLKERRFDVILLDLSLPDGQGLDTFIKIHQETPDTPVVILSGLIDEEIAFQAIHLGAQDYLVKGQEAWEISARTIRYAIERQRSKVALRDSENRFRNLFEHAPVAYLSLDWNGFYLDFNGQLLELLGYAPGELIGNSFAEHWSPETKPSFSRKFARFIQAGEINADIQLVKKDGTLIEVLMEGKVQYDSDRQFVQTHSVLFDITARKLAEQALRETQERFSAVFRSNPLSILITELADGTIVDANESFLSMFGFTRREILRHTPFELNIWQAPETHTSNLKMLRKHGEVTNVETKLRKKDGETIHALASYRLIELDGKHYVLNMLNDITDRKQKEQALVDSERRFLSLIENGLENISLITADGVLLWESPAVVRTLDYEPNTFVGQNILELLHPDDREKISHQFAELVQQPGSRRRDSFRLRHSDGAWRWVEAVATNFLNEPNINAIVINYHDINERKRIEDRLRESETRLSIIFSHSPIGIVVTRLEDGRILDANPAFASFYGYTRDEIIGQSSVELNMWAIPAEREALAKQLREKGTCHEMDIKARKKNGEICDLRISAELIEVAGEKVSLRLGQEITERKQSELELRTKTDEFAALYETTKDLSLELDVPKLMQQIVERANRLLESSGGFIYLYDQLQNELILTVVTEFGTALGTRLKMGEGMAGQVALTREPLIIEDYQNWQGRADVFAGQPFRSVVEVPMLSGGELIGILGVEQYEDSTRKFNEKDTRLLALFAGYAAGAVRTARLLNEANANAQQLSLLYDAGLTLSRELDPQVQLKLLFGMVQRALNADNAVFFRYDDAQRELYIESGVGAGMDVNGLDELRFTFGEERGLVGWVAQNDEPFYLADVQLDARWVEIGSDLHSVLWVPVRFEKSLLGILSIASRQVDAFSKSDQQLVGLFTNQIAVAMENARLFTALQKELAERKLAEQALSQSESLYRQAIEVAGAVPYYESYYDNGQRIKYEFIGEGIRNLTGYGPEEFSAALWDSLVLDVHPLKDLASYSLDDAIQRVRSGESPIWKCEHRIRHRNGEIRWIFEAAVELRDEHGVSRGSIGMYQDVTESRQAESALRSSEERYRGIFEGVQDAILVEASGGEILDVNQRACEIYGYSREEFLKKKVSDLVPVGRPIITLDENGLKELSYRPIEAIDVRANGEEFPVEISGRMYDFEGQKALLVVLRDITERKQAEEALLREQQRAQKYLDIAGIIMLALDQNGWVTLVNQKACEILGYPYEEIIGKDWFNTFLPPAVRHELKEVFQQFITGNNEAAYYENPILTRNGEERLIAWRNILIRDNNGTIISTLSSGEDITERKQAEKALRESERRYRALFEDMPIAIWEEDFSLVKNYLDSLKQQGITNFQAYFESYPQAVAECAALVKVLDVNNATLEMYRIDSKQELFNLKQIFSAEALMGFKAELIGLANGRTKFDLEGVDHRSDGEQIEINLNWVVVPGYEADLSKVIVLITDITERKLAEKALRESEQRYRTLIDQIPAVVYIDDTSTNPGRTQFVSPYIQTMLGFMPDEWIQGGEELWKDRLHPEERERVLAEFKQSIENDELLDFQYRMLAKDERVVWVHDQATTLRDNTGKPHSFHGVMYDITERKQAEASLRESEQRFRSLFNTSPDAILLIDPHDSDVPWRVLDCNEAACKMNGYTRAELVGQSVDMLNIAPETEVEKHIYLDSLRRKGIVHLESTHHHKDGHIFPIEISTSLLTIGGRELILGIDRDISERKRIESERQALLEVMAGANSTTDLTEYLKLVHHSVAKMIQAENFFVILNNKDTGLFEEIYSVDRYDPPQPPSKLEKSISAYVFRSAKPLLLTQALFDELTVRAEVELVGTNSSSWLGVPLITSKETIGVLVVQEYENANQYSERDQDFLVSIAGQVSLTVERIKAEAEINHQVLELEALHENGLAISRMLEPKQIARRIVQVLDQKLKWHHAAVRILHQESGQLELLALSQPGLDESEINKQIERVNQFNINLDYGLSGWVVKHRMAFRSGDLKQNPNYVETYPGIKSGLYVPIRSGEEIIGSIAVESEQESAFAQRDERLLITLANQAAISFLNARLYVRLQHELIERHRTEDQIRKLNAELEQRVQERTLEIEATHQRLELATASSGIGVWELNSIGTIFYWDERMHDIYGTLPEKFIPTFENWLEFVHPDDREVEAQKTKQAITLAGTYQSEFRIIRKDGSVRHINSHAIVLLDEQGNFKDMIGVHMDITTIKQAEETLRMANTELERALRVKDEFLANMSHELRTPLNAILGLSESLEEQIAGSLNEKQQRYVHTISESGHHLLTLINDILDLAKIEAGQIKLDINKMDIHAVCQSSLRMIRQLAQKKNQQVEFEIDDKLNLIWADERRLKQMLVNLLSNAVKFTAEGGKLGLTVQANESENKVVLTVWDSGIGIKESDLVYLFRPFVQLDAGLARESPGTGLGLALVAQMARLHGGSVSAASRSGVGSRFTITLPWEPALGTGSLSQMKITGKFRAIQPGSESSRLTILLVEDTEEVVMMLKDYLESAAYRVITANNGIEGIAQAKKFHPDLILMDVQMPGMDGLETTQRLRSQPEFQNTPIIALTAFAMQNDRERCLAAGMNEYISKPVHMKSLLKVIQSFLASA